MPIQSGDIKLMQSQRLTDTEDGGGRMTGQEVISGAENNLFDDISDLDRTYGRVSLRKFYAGVFTDDTDTYYGANLIVAQAPADPRVAALLMTTKHWSDQRAAAQAQLEAYVTEGALSELKLLGNHIEGQKLIWTYQRLGASLPEVGDVYVISEESGTTVVASQFVRVTKIEHEEVEYEDGQGLYHRRQVLLTISDPLRRTYPGGEPQRVSSYQPPSKLRRTSVVDAARYYGLRTLTAPAVLGDLAIYVDSIMGQLLPSTQSETPVVDVQAGGGTVVAISAGAHTVEIAQVAHTDRIAISLVNRGYNYVNLLEPLPAPGTLKLSYRSQGKWYVIEDSAGDGTLTGTGAGSINYATGSVSVTVQELPDVDTWMLYAWGTPQHYTVRTGQFTPQKPGVRLLTGYPGLQAGSVQVQWLEGGLTKTATDNGAGAFTGDATGTVVYLTGEVYLVPNIPPDANSELVLSYDRAEQVTDTLTAAASNRVVSFTIPAPLPLRPGRVRLQVVYPLGEPLHQTETFTLVDDGAGQLLSDVLEATSTVNYATGAVTLTLKERIDRLAYVFIRIKDSGRAVYDWVLTPVPVEAANTTEAYTWTVETADDLYLPVTENHPHPGVAFDLTPLVRETIMPGSVRFTWNNKTYQDNDGQLAYDVDAQGVGVLAGTINYASGQVHLTQYVTGTGNVTVTSLLTARGTWSAADMVFRTPGAPVRPGSFFLAATAVDGELLTATSDFGGVISGTDITGTIQTDIGVVDIAFGRRLLDSSLTAEDKAESWYDPANIDAEGYIWRPRPVLPHTARFNGVVYVFLPLSADVLGMDPVRLPMDGRVPIMRLGDVVVIHHTATVTGITATAGVTINLNRPRLARLKVVDNTGLTVPADRYSVDLDAGTLTWADPLELTGFTGPYQVAHTIEDMALVTDVDISGRLGINRPISHTFPALETQVSSALLIQDLRARATDPFGQATWTGVWADTLIGSATTAQYNAVLYPFQMTNRGAIQERWRINFISATTFAVIGETVGQIAVGDINTELAPTNPATGVPYFRILAAGWGSGWSSGNQLRFNTIAANYPIWGVRTIQPGPPGPSPDALEYYLRGNVDQ